MNKISRQHAHTARGRRAADPPAFRRRSAGVPRPFRRRSAGVPHPFRARSARDPHRCRTGAAPVPHRHRRRSAADPYGYPQTARKAGGEWVFPPVFFGVFVLLGVFLYFLGGVFARRRRAAHPPAFRTVLRTVLRTCSALAPHLLRTCSALVPHLCHTCSALVPHLCRTCAALVPHLFRTGAALVPHLCRTCAALVPHLCRTVGGSAARRPLHTVSELASARDLSRVQVAISFGASAGEWSRTPLRAVVRCAVWPTYR